MNEKNKQTRKMKRIKILDALLIAFANNKLVFKSLDEAKHFTMLFLKDGILDFHETFEGKEKRYGLAKEFNVKDFIKPIKEFIERLRVELPKIVKKIDISDSKFDNIEVSIIKMDSLEKNYKIKGKKITIDKNNVKNIMFTVPMKDLKEYDFEIALLTIEEKGYYLRKRDGRYILLAIDDFNKLLYGMYQKFFFKNIW